MSKKRFEKTEILKILKEYENGKPIFRIIEEYKISQATFYNWRAKYGVATSNEIKQLSKLKEDIVRLKTMFADLSLENQELKAQLKKQE